MSEAEAVFKILKVIESGNEPKKEDIGSDKDSFYELMEQIHDDNLVDNISFNKRDGRITIVYTNNLSLTKFGREYIKLKEEGRI